MSTTVYRWAKVDLPDPSTYYGGFKQGRIISWGEINRALSDDTGHYEGQDFSFLVSDTDKLIRALMDGVATRYGFRNRNITLRMISDADRRQLAEPLTIARGLLKGVTPLSPFQAQFECRDFVTSRFAGTNTEKQIPVRTITAADFVDCAQDVRDKAVPIIYGHVGDDASVTAPPVITGDSADGFFKVGGVEPYMGYGPLPAALCLPPTAPAVIAGAGGSMSATIYNGEWGAVVTAVDANGVETDPVPFHFNIDYAGTRGGFTGTPVPFASVDGTQKITVSWTASVGAAKYRVYYGWYYYGFRPQGMVEVNAPTVSVDILNEADGTLPTFNQFWYYAVSALMADGETGLSSVAFGYSGTHRRPLRLEWLAVPGALEYRIYRKSASTNWDRRWSVPASVLLFDDDLLDTDVTYVDGASVPRGVIPLTYVGTRADVSGFVWFAFLVCGHAVKEITAIFQKGRQQDAEGDNDPVQAVVEIVESGKFGVTFAVPGKTNYDLYFPNTGSPQYLDVNGHRYTMVFVRGPDGAEAADGTRPLTANVKGIETVGDGSGTLITSVIQQYKHFLVNWGFQSYVTGGWLTAPMWAPDAPTESQVDEASFDAADAVAAAQLSGGIVGGGIIGSLGQQEQLREWLARFNVSCGVDSAFSRASAYFVSKLDDRISALTGAVHLTQTHDIITDSFSMPPQPDRFFNSYPYRYSKDWSIGDTWASEEIVFDVASIANYLEESIAPTMDLYFIRDATTALNLMSRRLLLSKEPPLVVMFRTPLTGFDTELGDMVTVDHKDGLGVNGFVARPLRIRRLSLNPDDYSLAFECEDMARIYAGVFILGDETWAVDWMTASTVQRTYGFLADETTGLFSDGSPIKRLR